MFAPASPPSSSPGAKTASVERRIHNAEEQEKSGGLILDPSDGERGTTGGEKERNGDGETLPRAAAAAETSPPTDRA